MTAAEPQAGLRARETATVSAGAALCGAPAGLGLKPQHYRAVLTARPQVGFFEVHAENYFGAGGPPHGYLTAIREAYPLSIHGVGLSLGGAGPLDRDHLAALARLVRRYAPALVSEHLAWCARGGVWFNDLLPVPLTEEALDVVAAHVAQTQDALGRQILVENLSSYLAFAESEIPEVEFLSELVRRTGCGLLLDLNNIVVSAHNLGFDAAAYLDAVPADAVGEIHVAGHAVDTRGGLALKIDDHGSAPGAEVEALLARFVERAGPRPVLLEWDKDVPPLSGLVAAAARVDGVVRAAMPAQAATGRRAAASGGGAGHGAAR